MGTLEVMSIVSPAVLGGISLYGTRRAQRIAQEAADRADGRSEAEARVTREREEMQDRRAAIDAVIDVAARVSRELSHYASLVDAYARHRAGRGQAPDGHPQDAYHDLDEIAVALDASVSSLSLRLHRLDDVSNGASDLRFAFSATRMQLYLEYREVVGDEPTGREADRDAWDNARKAFERVARTTHTTFRLRGRDLPVPAARSET